MLNSYQFNTAQLNNTGSSPVNKNVSYVLDLFGLVSKTIRYLFDEFITVLNVRTYVLDIRNLATKAETYLFDA